MISSKKELQYYLECDRIALGIPKICFWKKKIKRLYNVVYDYQILLRNAEYYYNTKNSIFGELIYNYYRFRLHRLGVKLGFLIPINVFGPGLSIAHPSPILVSGDARIGANCRIHQFVSIGTAAGSSEHSPRIGDNVFIGAGAVIVGSIYIADGIAIGANSYVDKDFTEPRITIAGSPAKVISTKRSEKLYFKATERYDTENQ